MLEESLGLDGGPKLFTLSIEDLKQSPGYKPWSHMRLDLVDSFVFKIKIPNVTIISFASLVSAVVQTVNPRLIP